MAKLTKEEIDRLRVRYAQALRLERHCQNDDVILTRELQRDHAEAIAAWKYTAWELCPKLLEAAERDSR